ncbi:MAG: sugar phosphate isomerase/epimerase [Anaerolineae bacterium]|nr:sugar phosphate isomerase/epimerase [Anaerolineae bacterium]
MKISVASYSFHGLLREGQMDLFGYLESVKYRYGLDAADIWNGMLLSTDEEYLRKVKDALDERELVLVNLCVDGAHLWDPDPAIRERNRQNALAHLRAAEILGAKTVRIDIGGRSSEMTEEQFDWVVQGYQAYAQRAYDNGYRVGPENHFGPALVPENMKRIYEAVDNPGFGFLLHIGHWVEGRVDEGDRLLAPWAFHTHISWDIAMRCLSEKMTMMRDAGYDGYWGVEHHTGRNEYTEVAIQVAMVRDVLDRWRAEG